MLATFRSWRCDRCGGTNVHRPSQVPAPTTIALADTSLYAKTLYCHYITFHGLLLQSSIAYITLCLHPIADSIT